MPKARPSAFVFASDGDSITRFTFPAAIEVTRTLRLDDRLDALSLVPFRFPVKTPDGFLPSRAPKGSLHQIALLPPTASDLETKLATYRTGGGATKRPMNFVLGYGSGHGSERGITRMRDTPAFFTRDHAEFFRRGILVFAACFEKNTFPRELVKLPNHRVNAVFGYTYLWGFTPLAIETNSQREYHVFKARYIDCLVQPVLSLLRGVTAGEALGDCRQAWSALAQRCKNPDMRALAVKNEATIRLWGDPKARLAVP